MIIIQFINQEEQNFETRHFFFFFLTKSIEEDVNLLSKSESARGLIHFSKEDTSTFIAIRTKVNSDKFLPNYYAFEN